MKLKIDFHVHSHKSFDSTMSYEEIISTAKKRGLDGVCICDHACADIAESLANNNDDFIVIPAVEFTTGKNHIIGMFLEKEPDVTFAPKTLAVPLEKIVEETRRCGGICILAHPFERLKEGEAAVSKRTDEVMKQMSGMELYNARAPYKYSQANKLASLKAEELHTTCRTAGSDAHLLREIGNAYCVVDTPSRSLDDIKKAVLDGKVEIIGHHAKRVCVTLSELTKSKKFRRPLLHKLKLYASFIPRFALDTFDVVFGRKL